MMAPGADSALTALPAPAHVILLIGAEGGLDPQEMAAAAAAGFVAVRLGPRVLRTEMQVWRHWLPCRYFGAISGETTMFESAELGHQIDRKTFQKEVPKLRAELLDVQYDLLEA